MSYIFFDDVMEQLGYMINYNAIINLAGNSADGKEAWKMIMKANPLTMKSEKASVMSDIASVFLNGANIKVVNSKSPKGGVREQWLRESGIKEIKDE